MSNSEADYFLKAFMLLFATIAQLLAAAIHGFTIIVVIIHYGVGVGIIALILPVISQILWFIRMMTITGTIWNYYCISLLSYLVLIILYFLLFFIGLFFKKDFAL